MTGVDRAVRDCRGWSLVGRRQQLTPAEQAVAERHLAICRHCRIRLEESQLRARVWLRGGVVGATVAADVVAVTAPGGGASAAVALVGSKLGALAVGAAALAVAVTSTGVAVHRDTQRSSRVPAVRMAHHDHGRQQTTVAPRSSVRPAHQATSNGLPHTASAAPAPSPSAPAVDTDRSPQSVVLAPGLVPTILASVGPSLPALPLPSVSVPSVPLPMLTSVLGSGAH